PVIRGVKHQCAASAPGGRYRGAARITGPLEKKAPQDVPAEQDSSQQHRRDARVKIPEVRCVIQVIEIAARHEQSPAGRNCTPGHPRVATEHAPQPGRDFTATAWHVRLLPRLPGRPGRGRRRRLACAVADRPCRRIRRGLRPGHRGAAPGADLSCPGALRPAFGTFHPQPRFDVFEEGIDLLLVVARPQTGGRELLGPDLLCCQRRLPDPEEGVTDSVEEAIDLRHVITRPQPSGGNLAGPDRAPAGEAEGPRPPSDGRPAAGPPPPAHTPTPPPPPPP